jgi:hypothetical protein
MCHNGKKRSSKTTYNILPKDDAVSCIDFYENYAFMVQNEIQDMHWFNF